MTKTNESPKLSEMEIRELVGNLGPPLAVRDFLGEPFFVSGNGKDYGKGGSNPWFGFEGKSSSMLLHDDGMSKGQALTGAPA